ncbi:MAG: hypothetical protein LBK53_00205 [Heliobacteriaceae bacterium]|jgi:hypothetical protein|nr:hypothetical protein [Heliobacteriaceae bacterium]
MEKRSIKYNGIVPIKVVASGQRERGNPKNQQFRLYCFAASFLAMIFAVLLFFQPVFAAEHPSSVTVQNVSYGICNKAFNMPPEKLFYLAIASAGANRFAINEIQSKNGYILFTAANKEFLAAVVRLDKTHSALKITPVNNIYYFAPGIVTNFFKYIELNSAEEVKTLPKRVDKT